MAYVSVFPLLTTRAVPGAFTYEAPDGVGKGAVVEVRFHGARRRGVVVAVEAEPPDGVAIAPIVRVVEQLPPALVDLALWLADYYGSTPARALALVAPPHPARRGERRRPAERDALPGDAEPAELTASQQAALARIDQALASGGGSFLLHGATGSGKTEVYLRAAAATLERGKGAIVLVPEIALTPQAVGRFRARFGERVAILHSRLSDAERRDERERIAAGEAPVVIGPRSAVFAPVDPLGLVCVDEEQDASYKQESDPRYDARTLAVKRASLEGSVAVFGSATPRPESWARLERLELGGRLAAPLPPVHVVDLRREAGYPLSAPLLAELGRVAEHGGKAILLLNRRGVAPALHCRACGLTLRCPNCDVALVLHSRTWPAAPPGRRSRPPGPPGAAGAPVPSGPVPGRTVPSGPTPPATPRERETAGELRCHHCGHSEAAGETCSACGSAELARIGAGTQRLERELQARVPELERIRLDADTAGAAGGVTDALKRFAAADRAVLIGTQMVAKGHHFTGVSLAAVVDADAGLGLPDFRAEERTFQLLTQLAGRSGRDAPGRVVVQTFQPDSRAVVHAARHDVAGFLADELECRRELGYPPFRHLLRIVVSGREPDAPLLALTELRAGLDGAGADLLGPAPILRLRGRYRAQLVAKTDRPRAVAARAARLLAAAAPALRRAGLTAVVDVDPQTL